MCSVTISAKFPRNIANETPPKGPLGYFCDMSSQRPSYLIAGLGNPGERYANTRHNIGFMVVDAYVARLGLVWTRHGDLYEAAQSRIRGRVVELIKPLTFMNLSGKAIRKRMNECGLSASSVVVVTDEYNFPTGRIHLKAGGSSGGHNGISSVMEELATASFWRLRCGIDRKFGPGELVDYVLADFPADEAAAVADMISRACEVLAEIASAGPDLAMQKANRPIQPPGP